MSTIRTSRAAEIQVLDVRSQAPLALPELRSYRIGTGFRVFRPARDRTQLIGRWKQDRDRQRANRNASRQGSCHLSVNLELDMFAVARFQSQVSGLGVLDPGPARCHFAGGGQQVAAILRPASPCEVRHFEVTGQEIGTGGAHQATTITPAL